MKKKNIPYITGVLLALSCFMTLSTWPHNKRARARNVIMASAEDAVAQVEHDVATHVEVVDLAADTQVTEQRKKEDQKIVDLDNKNEPIAKAREESADEFKAIEPQENPQLKESVDFEDLERENAESQEDLIEFNFENASLEQLISYVADVFDYQFITPDAVDPVAKDEKKIKGNLISFKTQKPLSKPEVWNLFLTFIDMSGFAVVPFNDEPKIFRIVTKDPGAGPITRAPVPTFIGVDPTEIPTAVASSDQVIRYIYFIKNSTTDAFIGGTGNPRILDQIKSPQSTILALKEHNALLIIDKAFNIFNLMKIVKELDKVSLPQAMSVLKLRKADAIEVKNLYESLIKPDEKTPMPNRLLQRKQPTAAYFPENVKIIAEPRTNSLILLGPIDTIKKIEDFIVEHVDVSMEKPFSPLYVYDVKYANAETIARIMNETTKFGETWDEASKTARAVGAVRGGIDQYFKPMRFVAEMATNRIIIKGNYDDYIKAVDIIKQLDEPQPQVAVEILVIQLSLEELKILGTQMRSKEPCGTNGIFGKNITYQTSGSFTGSSNTAQGLQLQTPSSTGTSSPAGATQLLGNLLNLVTTAGAGNTVVSLGDALGAWAVIQALESLTSTQLVANPFLIATNKTKSKVSVTTIERVIDSQILQTGSSTSNTFKDEEAGLNVYVEPQISSDGMITLNIAVESSQFVGAVFNPAFVQKIVRGLQTKTVVADKEVIALGGIIQSTATDNANKVPLLADIPLLGWFFKNKSNDVVRDVLLILVATQLIPAEKDSERIETFNKRRMNQYEEILADTYDNAASRDPINKFFFENNYGGPRELYEEYMLDPRDHPARSGARRRKRFDQKQEATTTAENELRGVAS